MEPLAAPPAPVLLLLVTPLVELEVDDTLLDPFEDVAPPLPSEVSESSPQPAHATSISAATDPPTK
jgi:hypothetical protein